LSGAGQDVEAEVAPPFDPVVVLRGQDGADEADQGVAGWEDADDVGPAADLSIEALLRIVRPDLSPDLFGERGECQDVRAVLFEVRDDFG